MIMISSRLVLAGMAGMMYQILAMGQTPISSCGDLSVTYGNYVLTSNITVPNSGSPCFTIYGASHVTLDCAGHTISQSYSGTKGIDVASSDHFLITNCGFSSNGLSAAAIELANSSPGTIQYCTIGSMSESRPETVNVTAGRITFTNNTVYGSYNEASGNQSNVSNNAFSSGSGSGWDHANHISLYLGTNNTASNNTFANPYSAADVYAIALVDETGTTVSNNTIAHFDQGISLGGNTNSATISGNSITYVPVAINSSPYTSMQGNTFSTNTIDYADFGFLFLLRWGLRSGDTEVYFTDNTFSYNSVGTHNRVGTANSAQPFLAQLNTCILSQDGTTTVNPLNYVNGSYGYGDHDPSSGHYHMSNNGFDHNDFGYGLAPSFGCGGVGPASFGYVATTGGSGIGSNIVVDNGNNKCTQPSTTTNSNTITCH